MSHVAPALAVLSGPVSGDGSSVSARGSLARLPVRALEVGLLVLLTANLGRIPVLSAGRKEAPILFNDIALLGVLGVSLVVMLVLRRIVVDRVAVAAIAFAAVGGFSALVSAPRFGLGAFELLFGLAYLARWVVYFLLYLVVVTFVQRGDVERVWRAFERTVLLFAAFGIVQSAFLPGFAQLVYPDSELYVDWDPQGRRLVSTILDPNFAGAMILLALLPILARIAAGARESGWKVAMLLVALALTVSRSSILGLLVGVGIIVVARGVTRRMLRLGGLLLLLSLPAIPSLVEFARGFNKFTVDASALERLVAWSRAFTVWGDNVLFGVGFNLYGFVQTWYGFDRLGSATFSLDGGLLFIGVMTGAVGLAVYTAMLVLILRRAWRAWRNHGLTAEARGLALGIAAATVAMVVHSLFVNTLLLPFLMEPLWILWGLAAVLVARRDERPDASRRPSAPVLVALR